MAVRPPGYAASRVQAAEAKSPLSAEIAAEKAAALGRSASQVAKALEIYREALSNGEASAERDRAADVVYAFLIQRELLGLRDRGTIIEEFDIPRAVLARLGATTGKQL